MGRRVAGRDYHHAYPDISTCQQASSALDSEDFGADPVFQGREGGGGKGTFFLEANTSYLCFINGFLLSWLCVIHLQPHSLPPPV